MIVLQAHTVVHLGALIASNVTLEGSALILGPLTPKHALSVLKESTAQKELIFAPTAQQEDLATMSVEPHILFFVFPVSLESLAHCLEHPFAQTVQLVNTAHNKRQHLVQTVQLASMVLLLVKRPALIVLLESTATQQELRLKVHASN